MSRKKRKYSSEGFAMIYREVVESYAFKALTNPARVAYLLLKIQVKSAGQQDVKYPYSHAAEYMDRHTFAKAIRQLDEYGFINKDQEGGMCRKTNIYSFTERWRLINRNIENGISKRGADNNTYSPFLGLTNK